MKKFKKIFIFLIFYFIGFYAGLFYFNIYPRFTDLTKKPAVYFYPKEPTEVRLSLDKSIEITHVVPLYDGLKGWRVKAYPDGKLVDLQPELTDCKKLNYNKLGMEYAKKACENNEYPYLYWEGINKFKPVPTSKEGWVLSKGEIEEFLSNKLDELGFNAVEKKDFLEYWLKRISLIKENKVFIYFLQNEVLEEYLPEEITPKPDNNNRIYIVVKGVTEGSAEPQHLVKLVRKGFYTVDWGGIVQE